MATKKLFNDPARLTWLQAHPMVATASAGELVDGWYGYDEV
jgi:uncharacterized protein YggL (DUF469 family)